MKGGDSIKTFQQFLNQYYNIKDIYTFLGNSNGPVKIKFLPHRCDIPCRHIYPLLNVACNGTAIRIFNDVRSTTVCPFQTETGHPTLIKVELTNDRW